MDKIKNELIVKHIEGLSGLSFSSVDNFSETGRVSGSLLIALKNMLDEYASQFQRKEPISDEEMKSEWDNVSKWMRANGFVDTDLIYDWFIKRIHEKALSLSPSVDKERESYCTQVIWNDMVKNTDDLKNSNIALQVYVKELQKEVEELRQQKSDWINCDALKYITEINELKEEQENLSHSMIFRGNSVNHWHDKAMAYKGIVGRLADKLVGKYGDSVEPCVDNLISELSTLKERMKEVEKEKLNNADEHKNSDNNYKSNNDNLNSDAGNAFFFGG